MTMMIMMMVTFTSHSTGPECWWVHYPSASGGMQSPVDIITEETWQADSENSNVVPIEVDYNSARSLGASRYAGFNSSCNDESDAGSDLILKEVKILVNNGNTSRINFVNSRSCELSVDGLVG